MLSRFDSMLNIFQHMLDDLPYEKLSVYYYKPRDMVKMLGIMLEMLGSMLEMLGSMLEMLGSMLIMLDNMLDMPEHMLGKLQHSLKHLTICLTKCSTHSTWHA
ncbi:hypothetical protein E4U34_008102 [Claviceps purpurea]|nr:hypothetical protein E4U34_008102 [Claviceps purpurea]